jgi:hypothetical protein
MVGGENVRSKDMAVMHQGPESFLFDLVMDGIFERYPKLRGAALNSVLVGFLRCFSGSIGSFAYGAGLISILLN